MKLITFSLWGQQPKYLIGALKNAQLASEVYPDWICRFYVGASVPSHFVYELEKLKNVQIVRKPEWGDWRGMFWRFEPAAEDNVDVMISRDTDSRLNHREKVAVDEWLESENGFHIMRDHPYHNFPVLGGMWGVKKGVLPQMKEIINKFSQQDKYGTDYEFFAHVVVPLIKDSVMIHDEFFGGSNFPVQRNTYEFVGQIFDEHDKTVESHVDVLKKYLEEKLS